ncbi:hypothetical protein M440DRAFT_2639 [Trichoderma longibrachiatum ATCC 18648]|uniref:Ubiquitin-like protease family profile domain-containing protein n=1 Tax=Trichoderma longibrachiatum ATCC 18648 TaxID=983965 RepID=A0A2T4C935_TRILO|nr:hypothetical protein M440DRAFT_2639 [Trichoderma longibrachiatum ATCC 18648]
MAICAVRATGKCFLCRSSSKLRTSAPWRNGNGEHSDPRLEAGDELVEANLPGHQSTIRVREALYICRFVTTFFNLLKEHWVAAVFDQLTARLIILDTIEGGRDKRAKAAGFGWRSFVLNVGFPCLFRVVSTPVAQQPNRWACGYIGLINVLLMKGVAIFSRHICWSTGILTGLLHAAQVEDNEGQ